MIKRAFRGSFLKAVASRSSFFGTGPSERRAVREADPRRAKLNGRIGPSLGLDGSTKACKKARAVQTTRDQKSAAIDLESRNAVKSPKNPKGKGQLVNKSR